MPVPFDQSEIQQLLAHWVGWGLSFPSCTCSGSLMFRSSFPRLSEYKRSLEENHFSPIMGPNARAQPGSLQDVLLHETAVSWLRMRLTRSTPKKCWEETREEYGRRLKRCCEEVNKECDVEGLCQGFPKRIKLLKDKEGERLPH